MEMNEAFMKETLQKQRDFYKSGVTLDLDWRVHQLKILKKTLKKYEENLVWALRDDLENRNLKLT